MQIEGQQPDLVSRPLAINSKPRAILTSEKAVEIFSRSVPPTGSSSAERPHATSVAREYGVSEKTVRDIWTGRTWSDETRHLDPHRPPREAKPTGRPRGRQDTEPRKRKLNNCEDSVSMQSLEAGTWPANGFFYSLSRGNYTAIIHPVQEARSTSRSGCSVYDEGNCRKYPAISVIDDSDCQRNLPCRQSYSPYCTLNNGPLPLSALRAGQQTVAQGEGEHWPQGCQEAVDFDLSCVSSTSMRGSWDSGAGAAADGAAADGDAGEGPRKLSGQLLGSFAVWKLDVEYCGTTRAGGGFNRPEEWRRSEDAAYRNLVGDGSAPDCGPLVPTGLLPDVARAVGRPAREPGAPSAAYGPPGARNEQLGLPYPTNSGRWQGPARIAAAANVYEPNAQDQTLHQWNAANDGRAGIWADGGGSGGGGGGCGSGDGSDGGAGGGRRVAAGITDRNRDGGRDLGEKAARVGGNSDGLAWNGPACGHGWGGASMDPLRACDAAAVSDIPADVNRPPYSGQAADGGGSWAEYSRPTDSGPTAGGRSFAQPPAAASSSNRWPDTSSAAAAIGAGSLRPFELGCWGAAPPPQPPTSTATRASVAVGQEGQGGVAGHGFWGRRQEQHSRQGCCQHSEQTQDADGQRYRQQPRPEQTPAHQQQREQQRHSLQMQPPQMQQPQMQPHQQRPRWHPQQDQLQHLYELPQGQPQQYPQQHMHRHQHKQQLQPQEQQQYQHQHHLPGQLMQMQQQQQHEQYWAESEQQFKQHENNNNLHHHHHHQQYWRPQPQQQQQYWQQEQQQQQHWQPQPQQQQYWGPQ